MDLHSWKLGTFLYGLGSGIAEVPAYMISVSLLYIFNRKKSLFLTFIICSVCYMVAAYRVGKLIYYVQRIFYIQWLILGTWQLLVVLLVADIETSCLMLIGTLYAAENTPITQRCAAIGWTMAFGKFLPNILMVTLSLTVKV